MQTVVVPTRAFNGTAHAVGVHSVARVQGQAPHWTADAVVDGQFTQISLDDYKVAFSEASDKFKALGCEVVGASIDSKFSHLAWINTPRKEGGLGSMKIPLLADITKQISYDYGLLIESGENIGVALRGTFIIDPSQKVRHISINDLGVGRNVEETLRLVEAFQFNDEHGEVCPANWKKGGKTITPDVEKSKAYFSSVN
ncbi:hypothetical protein HK101_010559 [Irineochytrium annulatum]|nr:hypothetical protein HK101_010559 [Irineochytrium annulatum]